MSASLLDVLLLRAGYNTSLVLLACALLGGAAGMIGTFTVLRGRALVSDALSHAALPGVALAFLVGMAVFGNGRSLPLLMTGASLSGVLGLAGIQWLTRSGRLPEDAAIGSVLSVFFGVGIVLLTVVQSLDSGDQGGLMHFIYGQAAALRASDAQAIAVTGGGVVLVMLLLFKELKALTFDPVFAATLGLPVGRLDFLLMLLLGAVTIVGIQAVGILMIVALIVIPPVAARFWTRRLGRMVVLASLFGALSAGFGAALSAVVVGLPTGAAIVLIAGGVFAISFVAAPHRGLVARGLRSRRVPVEALS